MCVLVKDNGLSLSGHEFAVCRAMIDAAINRQVPTSFVGASGFTRWTLRSLASLRMTAL